MINQITVIFLEKKVQLDNKVVWGISFVWYQVLPKIFFIGEMIFTESSVIFIPTRNEFKFSILSYNEEELLRAIGSRVGGLAAHDPNYQVRQDILAATAKKEVIQRGMNILQRFNYNIDCTGESKNEGYLYIDRKFIKDIIINQGTLKIFTSETRNYSFSSLTIKLTEAECNINLRKWLDNDYDGLTSSLIVSKTIAPKVLLDGLLNKRVFSSKLIDSFLDDEKESLYFFELYKGLGHEDKQQIIKQAMIVSESLHNKLTDTQFMATIDYREQNTESNCFIATAVYEDPNSEPIQILRYFRDNILIKSCIGQTFIKQYYNCSPSIANYIANKRLFKELIKRFVLNPIIWIIRKAC